MPVSVSPVPRERHLCLSPRSQGREPTPALRGWADHRDGLSRAPRAPTAHLHGGHPPRAASWSLQPRFAWGAAMRRASRRGGGDGARRGGPRPAGSRRHADGLWQGASDGGTRHGQPARASASRSAPAAVPWRRCGAGRWAQPSPRQSSIPCQSVLEGSTQPSVTESQCLPVLVFFC